MRSLPRPGVRTIDAAYVFPLPPKGFKRLLEAPPNHRKWLLTADDAEHPIPYVRVNLGLDTLELLAQSLSTEAAPPTELIDYLTEERTCLQQRWDGFFGPIEQLYYGSLSPEIVPAEMRQIGKDILTIMLTTPLDALVVKATDAKERRTLMDVFFDRDVKKIEGERTRVLETLKGVDSQEEDRVRFSALSIW